MTETSLSSASDAGARARGAWALFDWAAQPYFTLITTFIFAPYFVSVLVGDGVRGQALWGYLQAGIGIALALTAPLLGTWLDRSANPRPIIAGACLIHITGTSLLWLALPGQTGLVIAFFGIGLAALGIEYATLATDTLLPRLAKPGRIGKLSGSAWALGYVGGLASLGLVMVFIAPAPDAQVTIAGLAPIFGLNSGDGGPARATGVFSALWFALFVIPLFIFVPMKSAGPPEAARRTTRLVDMWRLVRADRPLLTYLVAHMTYHDGLVAIFAFGGIYGVALFGWSTFELGLFGILLSITAGLGAWAGGHLDDRFGSLPVIAGAIALFLAAILAILSIEPAGVATISAGGLFATGGERAYLAASTLIGFGAGPLQASSRTFMARLAPPDKVGVYFGLLAFSGKATAFFGPLMVALVTSATGSQRVGLVPIAGLFVVGAGCLLLVSRQLRRRSRQPAR